MRESESLSILKGVGKKTTDLFSKLGVYSLGDILSFFPRTYEKYPDPITSLEDLVEGEYAAFTGMYFVKPVTKHFRGTSVTSGRLTGHEMELETVWFRMPYLTNQIQVKMPYVAYGRVSKKGSRFRLDQPRLFEPVEYERLSKSLQPVYSLTKGLSNKMVGKVSDQALNLCLPVNETLPEELLRKRKLSSRSLAIEGMHHPKSEEHLSEVKRRFTYEEFLSFFLGHLLQSSKEQEILNPYVIEKDTYYGKVKESLPFELTEGQKDALDDFVRDVHGEHVSERLIQGDVGSGKTILAFLCMILMAENGYQAALMAPTEVLAEQHQKTMEKLLLEQNLPFTSVLLTGSITGKKRKEVLEKISSGEAQFIIGTHALIQEKVEYNHLSLVITDEQHRFGVKQRSAFGEKGQNPFSLVMSATPIPRTLALILYQGMRVSVIRDVPSNRLPIKTAILKDSERTKAWQFVLKEVRLGHQAYIICPLVEETENSEGENVQDYAEELRTAFQGEVSVGILHGRMKPDEKNQVMNDFSEGQIQVLVSTTVVEVGVNVPNATVMVIENAERFGLSQLHQLRGRVGRGDAQSFCILMNHSKNEKALERLNVIRDHRNGFDIAEKDLAIRGPGDVSGVQQSGDLPFVMADLYMDQELMEMASQDATKIMEEDPYLLSEEHTGIRRLAENGLSEIYTNL